MKKGQNFNHPVKGSRTKVDPIKSKRDIKAIKKLLSNNPRDYALFTIGINTNLRASDLLNLKAGQLYNLRPMDEIEVREKKTGKVRRISLNKACVEAIEGLLASRPYKDKDFIFQSQRGVVLTVPSVNRLVKQWAKALNLKGNYGSHTLRKTFGYQQRVSFNVGIPELMICFNHSTQKQTLDYLCIQPDEIRLVYANEI
jgi:integrase